MPHLDLATLQEAIAAAVPDRECLVWRDQRMTWRQLTERTRRLASLLHAHGLGIHGQATAPWISNHDHLALYLHNGPEYVEGLVGSHKARVAPFNVNYRYVDDELAYLFNDAQPKAVIYHARFAGTLERVLRALDHKPLLLQVADESRIPLLEGALDYEAALAAASPEPLTDVRPSPEDLHILYTGGTTGMPKGVLWRIGDLINGPLGLPECTLEEAVAAAIPRERHRVLVAPPLMHGAGTWSALGAWIGGAAVVLPDIVDRFDANDALATIERERVTRMPVVGDAFARPLADALDTPVSRLDERGGAADVSSLRQIVNSGAAINPAVKQRLAARLPHVKIIDVVGSSETGFQVTRLGAADQPFAPAPGAAVVSANRTRLLFPKSGAAEESVKAEKEPEYGWLAKIGAIPLGYLGDPDKTAATFLTIDGVRMVVAGDRAQLVEDGTIRVFGRESTTINTGGEKVFAEEVEAVVRAVPGVAEALVVGRPSERWGQEIVAVVRLTGELGDKDLREACARHLARYKLPKAFLRTDHPLRLPNGKADYAAARAIVSEQPRESEQPEQSEGSGQVGLGKLVEEAP